MPASIPHLLIFLPAALLLDRLLGDPPNRWHPLCLIGLWAGVLERRLRRGPDDARLNCAGALACAGVVLPCAAMAWGLVRLADWLGGAGPAWAVAVLLVYVCLAPQGLCRHAARVAAPLRAGDVPAARAAVGMMVGRRTTTLDAPAVARACVESVAENLTDGVCATLFWAAVGLCCHDPALAAALAVAHRAANTLDALWGRRDACHARFGAACARLDDVLNLLPARLTLPIVALAALITPGCDARAAWRVGWRDHAAHESPNSAWSEAAFAGALGLRLGGPAVYGEHVRPHPWLGTGTEAATPEHIERACRLMWRSTLLFAAVATGIAAWANWPTP